MNVVKWVSENPVLFSAVVWPVVSGIIVSLFKPRTREEYAKMHPRWAGFLIFLSGFGLDPARTSEGLKRVLTAETDESNKKKLEDTKP